VEIWFKLRTTCSDIMIILFFFFFDNSIVGRGGI
jgi:hypothetical protein